ncbi:alanine racemase [Formosa sp. Hel3_A1_48]|jgi:pyridoxal phosphate enzyme (YggS family)|uniref:YggS family pyridoxal phosphate-dependent enzyme n=1 Tax=Formosa sp. Hel3_A1_48 TaxID=1336795 RepID=UPI00084E30B4|nr:YggS family pyridoxal phosphate-dependent enzyme [Formosa sp. Hel3_A1_48]AOR25478.1 alanine racemase [Formosa sp. Hel3_A1_48]MDC0950747.1 YggS family pyridoxal phosphate-dependent enzyme [Flavobacteriaceae bacterium]MDG1673483.1 YggS family pyridoxal phosphate-dependent enzyme [Flavobacteriaceae bacterium]MDG2484185.1 YggS family pyridoxal phosphate-dependent enzyme [Flavobacteriaceae bacterium]
MSIKKQLQELKSVLPKQVTLVAVSKTKPVQDLMKAYDVGQRIFGENKVQEMVEKYQQMPKDIQWHMIGHVQRNKVKYMAPFVDLIHGVDSLKLLSEINKQALKNNRCINGLLQIKIAAEDSKFGMTKNDAIQLMKSSEFKNLKNIKIKGVMGMATFTDDQNKIRKEFETLKSTFSELKSIQDSMHIISMGMSGDYPLAIECGSTMIRVGSYIFGARNYQ